MPLRRDFRLRSLLMIFADYAFQISISIFFDYAWCWHFRFDDAIELLMPYAALHMPFLMIFVTPFRFFISITFRFAIIFHILISDDWCWDWFSSFRFRCNHFFVISPFAWSSIDFSFFDSDCFDVAFLSIISVTFHLLDFFIAPFFFLRRAAFFRWFQHFHYHEMITFSLMLRWLRAFFFADFHFLSFLDFADYFSARWGRSPADAAFSADFQLFLRFSPDKAAFAFFWWGCFSSIMLR